MRILPSVLLTVAGTMLLTGCMVRTYPLVRERVDQDTSTGNGGYISGSRPAVDQERKTKRTTHVMEVELGSKWKYEHRPAITQGQGQEVYANEPGEGSTDMSAPSVPEIESPSAATPAPVAADAASGVFENYVIQKGDTLQKISDRFFGTTKKWYQIYQANKDTLKTPDRIVPGRTIRIPVDKGSAGSQKIK